MNISDKYPSAVLLFGLQMSSVVKQGAGTMHYQHTAQQHSDLLFPGRVIEESITSQLIDQRVLQQSGAPSTAADSGVSSDNQQKMDL